MAIFPTWAGKKVISVTEVWKMARAVTGLDFQALPPEVIFGNG